MTSIEHFSQAAVQKSNLPTLNADASSHTYKLTLKTVLTTDVDIGWTLLTINHLEQWQAIGWTFT